MIVTFSNDYLFFLIKQINGNLSALPNIDINNLPSTGVPFSSPFCYRDSKNSPTIKITILTKWGDGDDPFSVNFVNGGFRTHKNSQFVVDHNFLISNRKISIVLKKITLLKNFSLVEVQTILSLKFHKDRFISGDYIVSFMNDLCKK